MNPNMKCLIIILNACNKEYISKNRTPFLYSLRETGSYTEVKTTPTFAARVELFTGNSPSTTDTFVDFVYNPDNSPFKFIKLFKNRVVNFKKRRMITRKLVKYLSKVDPLNIPLGLLPYFSLNNSMRQFAISERERKTTHFFGILEENGFNVKFIHGQENTIEEKTKTLSLSKKRVLILHITTLDDVGHKYGPNSPEIRESLQSIDISIRRIFEFLRDEISFVVAFSDHNMVQVRENVNLWTKLQEIPAKIGVDYVVFLNSPMCRFWVKNRIIATKIRKFLASLKEYGEIITKEELTKRAIPTDRKYGDIIFWMKKGTNISPDFYHFSNIRGMHGYFCDAEVPLIVFHKTKKIQLEKDGRLRDIMPTILNLLDIPHEPADGRSLIIDENRSHETF